MSQTQDTQGFMRNMAERIRTAHRQIYGSEFIPAYGKLVDQLFLGSFSQTIEKIQAGDEPAVEFALVFVETRPYYFCSQYQRTKLIRILKHTKLSPKQTERFTRVLELEHEKKLNSSKAAVRKLIGDLKQKTRRRNPHA